MSGVVNFDTIATDIERAPKSALGKIDRETLRDVWAATSRFIAQRLASGSAVKVLNFGTFAHTREKLEFTDGSVRDATVPHFAVTAALAARANVAGGKASARPGSRGLPGGVSSGGGPSSFGRVCQLNPTVIAQQAGCARDVVTTAIKDTFVFIADRVRMGNNVQLIFPGLGKLLSRADKMHFRFTPALIESISGGTPVNARLAHRMLTTNQRGRYLGTEGAATRRTSAHAGDFHHGDTHSQERSGQRSRGHQQQQQQRSRSRSRQAHDDRDDRAMHMSMSMSMGKTQGSAAGAYEDPLAVHGSRPVSSGSSQFSGGGGGRRGSSRGSSRMSSRMSSSRRSSRMSHVSLCGRPDCAAQNHGGLCKMCREREAVMLAKREAERREREMDRLRAEEDALRAAEMERADREKQAERARQRREDALFNIRTLNETQRANKAKLRNAEMGSLFANRKDEDVDVEARRTQIRSELDEQVRAKRDKERELRRRDLEIDREQREAADRAGALERTRRERERAEARDRARRDLEDQMRSKADAVPGAYDAIDHGFTASEGPEQIEARRRRALELQAEQRALIAARAEAKRFEKRAEADFSVKENLKTRAALDREISVQHNKREAMKGDLRSAWDEQIAAKARAKELEKYGQERGLTSLALPDMDEDDDDNCIRCGGPMPDGIRIKVPNRVNAGIKA